MLPSGHEDAIHSQAWQSNKHVDVGTSVHQKQERWPDRQPQGTGVHSKRMPAWTLPDPLIVGDDLATRNAQWDSLQVKIVERGHCSDTHYLWKLQEQL